MCRSITDDVSSGGGIANHLSVLVLANTGSLSDNQCDAVEQFVAAGGGLVATGESSLYDEEGTRRDDFTGGRIGGVHAGGDTIGTRDPAGASWDAQEGHSYLRIRPQVRASVDGPLTGAEPLVTDASHAVLAGASMRRTSFRSEVGSRLSCPAWCRGAVDRYPTLSDLSAGDSVVLSGG